MSIERWLGSSFGRLLVVGMHCDSAIMTSQCGCVSAGARRVGPHPNNADAMCTRRSCRRGDANVAHMQATLDAWAPNAARSRPANALVHVRRAGQPPTTGSSTWKPCVTAGPSQQGAAARGWGLPVHHATTSIIRDQTHYRRRVSVSGMTTSRHNLRHARAHRRGTVQLGGRQARLGWAG